MTQYSYSYSNFVLFFLLILLISISGCQPTDENGQFIKTGAVLDKEDSNLNGVEVAAISNGSSKEEIAKMEEDLFEPDDEIEKYVDENGNTNDDVGPFNEIINVLEEQKDEEELKIDSEITSPENGPLMTGTLENSAYIINDPDFIENSNMEVEETSFLNEAEAELDSIDKQAEENTSEEDEKVQPMVGEEKILTQNSVFQTPTSEGKSPLVFKFHLLKGKCLNDHNERGFNFEHMGECGDLSNKVIEDDLRKISLLGANLKGADLRNARFRFFDLLWDEVQIDHQTVFRKNWDKNIKRRIYHTQKRIIRMLRKMIREKQNKVGILRFKANYWSNTPRWNKKIKQQVNGMREKIKTIVYTIEQLNHKLYRHISRVRKIDR